MSIFRRRAKLIRYDDSMSNEQVIDAFHSISPGNPFWQALDHVIDQTLLDAIDEASNPKNAESTGLIAHAAGGVDKLSTLKAKIQGLRARSADLGELARLFVVTLGFWPGVFLWTR